MWLRIVHSSGTWDGATKICLLGELWKKNWSFFTKKTKCPSLKQNWMCHKTSNLTPFIVKFNTFHHQISLLHSSYWKINKFRGPLVMENQFREKIVSKLFWIVACNYWCSSTSQTFCHGGSEMWASGFNIEVYSTYHKYSIRITGFLRHRRCSYSTHQ